MAPPQIATTLGKADNWASWLQQVNAYTSSLDWKDYLTHDAGFSPPAPPTPPPVDGMRGSQKLLEWSYDRERSKYEASKAEYEEFLVAVKRSIDPALGVDASDGRGFKELFEHVKARLDIDNVIEKPKLEGVWRVLMEQGLGEMRMKEWGDKVVEAYRFLKELRSSLVNGWDPYLEFVDNINKVYPVIAPAIYFRLYDMQRQQEKEGLGDPAGSVFEEFVRINVAMISRLAKPNRQKIDNPTSQMTTAAASGNPGTDKRGAESSVADLSSHKQPKQEAIYPSPRTTENKAEAASAGNTAERKEKYDGAFKRPAGRNPGELKDILVAKTPKLKAQAKATRKLPATDTGNILNDHKKDKYRLDTPSRDRQPRITLPTTSKQESTDEKKHERGLRAIPCFTDDRKQGNRIAIKTKLEGEEHKDTFPVTTKEEIGGDQKKGRSLIISKESFNGRAQDGSICGSLKLERLEDKPKVTPQPLFKQEESRDQKQQVRLSVMPGKIPGGRKQGTVPPGALRIMTREQKPQELGPTTSNEENRNTQRSQFQRPITPNPSSRQQDRTLQSLTPTVQRDNRKAGPAPTTLKRKNEEEHKKRPGAPERLRISIERRREQTPRDEDSTCYICLNTNHPTSDCRLLEKYRRHGDYAQKLGRSAMERCRKWLRDEAGGWYCRVCMRGGHDTEKCVDLRAYRKYGAKMWGMNDSTKARCEEILREETGR